MVKMGLDGKAYISADLHEDLPTALTYLELDLIETIEHEFTRAEAQLDDRKSEFTRYGSGQAAISYTVLMTYVPGDAAYLILENALINRTKIGLAVMDDDITTSGIKGWLLDVEVFGGPKGEAPNEFDKIPFVLKPSAKSDYVPTRHTVP